MKSRAVRQAEWDAKWGDLSRYNDEVAHGVVHTPLWDRKMQLLRKEYEEALRKEFEHGN